MPRRPRSRRSPRPPRRVLERDADAETIETPDGLKVTPVAQRVAAAQGIDLSKVQGTGPNGRIGKADVLSFERNGATATTKTALRRRRAASRPCSRARARCSPATWTSRGRSRPRPRSAPSPSPRSTATASSSRAPGQKVSFTHLIAYAIARAATEQMPVMATHFAEIDGKPHVIDDGAVQPRHRRGRREEGRRPHADGAGDQGRRPPHVPAVPGRVRRADHQGAREQADRGRPPGRQRLAHQPRRHRDHRVRAAPDERAGHDRRHRRDRLPARPRGRSAPRSAPRR